MRHVEALVTTDRLFFEAGATNERVGSATFSWMEGLTSVAAGCVVHSVEVRGITPPDEWLDAVEGRVRTCGAPRVRIYLGARPDYLGAQPDPLHDTLRERGYSARVERAYTTTRPLPPPLEEVRLHHLSISDDASWASLAALHRESGIGSGIYDADPDEWTELWRRKCATGDMDGYLVTCDGAPCGSVGVLSAGGVLRLKNTLVDRRVRRRAIARSILSLLSAIAGERDCAAIGAFVVDGTDGRALLEAAGFEDVGAQVEWSRVLP